MTWFAYAVLLALLDGQGQALSGTFPDTLSAPSRVSWVGADQLIAATCAIEALTRWQCPDITEKSRGVVIAVGIDAVAYRPVGIGDVRMTVKKRGRLIVLQPGAVAPDDLHDMRLTASVPARSLRVRSTRLVPTKDASADVVPLSDLVFWVATDIVDPDAFVTIDGPAIGSTRIGVATAMEGPPEVPLFVSPAMALSLEGRIQGPQDAVLEQADVEVFAPVAPPYDDVPKDFESQVMIRIGATRSDQDGMFRFDRIGPGPFLVSVTDPRGRGTAIVKSIGDPLVIRLVASARATGRVLRHHVPVMGARVRFLPSAEAFAASTNAKDLISEEQITREDGRFSVSVPPEHSGVVQIVAPDGASVRVTPTRLSATGDIVLGDVTLPDVRRVTIRVLDTEPCTLTAIGPIGTLGLTIVNAAASASNVHSFELPEPGQWMVVASCGGKDHDVKPPMIAVSADGPEPTVDVRVIKNSQRR